jgi:hypothetical protein
MFGLGRQSHDFIRPSSTLGGAKSRAKIDSNERRDLSQLRLPVSSVDDETKCDLEATLMHDCSVSMILSPVRSGLCTFFVLISQQKLTKFCLEEFEFFHFYSMISEIDDKNNSQQLFPQ